MKIYSEIFQWELTCGHECTCMLYAALYLNSQLGYDEIPAVKQQKSRVGSHIPGGIPRKFHAVNGIPAGNPS